MKLHSLTIPETPAEVADMLERQLVGLELREFIGELQAIHELNETERNPTNLSDLLAESEIVLVLKQGLTALSDSTLYQLLKHPELLFPLQEIILIQGGDYWRQVPINFEEMLHEEAEALSEKLGFPLTTSTPPPTEVTAPTKPKSNHFWKSFVAPLVTCCLLIAAAVYFNKVPGPAPGPAPAPGWGFAKSGLLEQSLPADQFLTKLSAAGKDWYNKRPEDKEALQARIATFISGCQEVMNADLNQLAPEDRAWLKERCQAWILKLEEHIASLEAGTPAEDVLKEADTTVDKLINALKTRAEQLG